jgi:Nif-specific regulatory protein
VYDSQVFQERQAAAFRLPVSVMLAELNPIPYRKQDLWSPPNLSGTMAEVVSQDSPAGKAMAAAFLVSREAGVWHDIFRLPAGTTTGIGRDPMNRVILRDDKCSRRHCDVYREGEQWMLRDRNSRNGTRINGHRIANEVPIHEGDAIQIGNAELLFTEDISRPLNQSSPPSELETLGEKDDTESGAPQILERKSQSRYLTESRLVADSRESELRGAFARLYRLVVKMVSAADIRSLSETVLDELLTSVNADIGAVLVYPPDADDRTDPRSLRIISYRAPDDAPYQKVSTKLSRVALTEREAILAVDIGSGASENMFQTLSEMSAQSVICAPIRYEEQILGLLHLYSLNSTTPLDVESLEYTLAVADQFAMRLGQVSQQDQLAGELERAFDQNRSLRRLLEIESDLIGDSHSMQALRDSIARVATSDATALVRGESGVGKELVARAIHFNSNRREAPFVCLNCAALTESLLESELFGHERGSFTGATGQKIGKFEQADGGTLFLDEVGEMPSTIQAKFLRVLEGHPFERVGGNSDIHVDVRVVAATNRELEAAVEEGSFRKDLFFRLQILELHVPALREHASDLPALALYFLERCCQRIGHPQLNLPDPAMEKLSRHEWPGNVRELRNVIERAVVLSDGPEILERDIRLISTIEPKAWLAEDPMLSYEPVSMDDVEREHILRTLKWTNWNKREASRVLGINRSTLDRKIDRYGFRPSPSE